VGKAGGEAAHPPSTWIYVCVNAWSAVYRTWFDQSSGSGAGHLSILMEPEETVSIGPTRVLIATAYCLLEGQKCVSYENNGTIFTS
jgi:hypothetical protein